MRSRSLAVASTVAVCLGVPPAAAQLAQCTGLTNGTTYKVLVDEVKLDQNGAAATAVPIELLRNSVDGALEKVRQNALGNTAASARVDYLNCRGRHPSGVQDFDDAFVRSLLANHAILELWGTLTDLGSNFDLSVYYMMFPLSSHGEGEIGRHHVTTKETMARKPDAGAVLKYLTKTRTDLPAYFTLAAGVEAFADQRYEQALRLLCEARTRLRTKADAADFAAYADTLAGRAAKQLRGAGDSNAITLLTPAQAKNYCDFATRRS